MKKQGLVIYWNQFVLKNQSNIKVALYRKSKLVYTEMVDVHKSNKSAPIFLNKCAEVPIYDFETYKSCGLKIDLTFAVDLTISNGNFKKGERSLHPETYSKIMQ